jgi:hypothetical protein
MNEQLNDIVDSLWEHIMGVMQGEGGEICADYLRITCQKCLFAQERLKSLAENVADYKKKLDCGEILNSLYLAMDYDHLLISLRSSLEHLAKLINAAISQSLPNRLVIYQETANLRNTISVLKESTELSAYSSLYRLSCYLNEKINHAWYKELMEPGIVISHDKFRKFPKVSASGMRQQLLDFSFLLPHMAETEGTGEGGIVVYCRELIEEVEGMLKGSFIILDDHLSRH